MNAALRAIVRNGLDHGYEVLGVREGYAGLVEDALTPLGPRDVGGIIQQGGTILGSTRCAAFRTPAGQQRALATLEAHGIEGLIVIGGNGSQAGAHALSQLGFSVVGVASTIDNDLVGSDITIGVDSALNVAVEAIDRLKVTASSHHRAVVVEVMGRDCGYLALMAGIAGGAEAITLPEVETDPDALVDLIRAAYLRGKAHAIVVASEHATLNADGLTAYFQAHQERLGFGLRVTKLGHVQRGGSPGVADRLLATRLGAAAVETLARGQHGVLIGVLRNEVATTPFADVVARTKPLDQELLALAQVLARY
jgi:6-phosphofructokinase 1